MTHAQTIQHMILKKGILYEECELAWGREMLALPLNDGATIDSVTLTGAR